MKYINLMQKNEIIFSLREKEEEFFFLGKFISFFCIDIECSSVVQAFRTLIFPLKLSVLLRVAEKKTTTKNLKIKTNEPK